MNRLLLFVHLVFAAGCSADAPKTAPPPPRVTPAAAVAAPDEAKWQAWQTCVAAFVAEARAAIAAQDPAKFRQHVTTASRAQGKIPIEALDAKPEIRSAQLAIHARAKECELHLHTASNMLKSSTSPTASANLLQKAARLLDEIEASKFYAK